MLRRSRHSRGPAPQSGPPPRPVRAAPFRPDGRYRLPRRQVDGRAVPAGRGLDYVRSSRPKVAPLIEPHQRSHWQPHPLRARPSSHVPLPLGRPSLDASTLPRRRQIELGRPSPARLVDGMLSKCIWAFWLNATPYITIQYRNLFVVPTHARWSADPVVLGSVVNRKSDLRSSTCR